MAWTLGPTKTIAGITTAYYLEQIRLIISTGYLGYLLNAPTLAFGAIVLILVIGSKMNLRQWFLRLVYG